MNLLLYLNVLQPRSVDDDNFEISMALGFEFLFEREESSQAGSNKLTVRDIWAATKSTPDMAGKCLVKVQALF